MPFDEPDRMARSRRQGVLYEVYRLPMGAELYIPEPLSWTLRLHPSFRSGEAKVAVVCCLASARARRLRAAAARARREALAEAWRAKAAQRRRSRRRRQIRKALALELLQLGADPPRPGPNEP